MGDLISFPAGETEKEHNLTALVTVCMAVDEVYLGLIKEFCELIELHRGKISQTVCPKIEIIVDPEWKNLYPPH